MPDSKPIGPAKPAPAAPAAAAELLSAAGMAGAGSAAILSSWKSSAAHDEEESDSERWLVSFADFITLLMVLFMMLYALQLVKNKDLVLSGLRSPVAASEVATAAASAPVAPVEAPASDKTLAELRTQLQALRERGDIKLTSSGRGLEIEINARLLFASGEARLLPDALPVLKNVAKALRQSNSRGILVEGHTDSQPISNGRFESNWELSSARAGAVVRYLVDHGIEPTRLAAMGRADNVPAAIGDSPEALAANRRVSILVQY